MKKRGANALIAAVVLLSGQVSFTAFSVKIVETAADVSEAVMGSNFYPESMQRVHSSGGDGFSYESIHRSETDIYPFDDVRENSVYYKAVHWLWDHGIINDYRYFRPEANVYAEDAARAVMLVYRSTHDVSGMVPGSAISQAEEYGLFPGGISGNPGLDVGSGLEMLYRLGLPMEPLRGAGSIPGLTASDPEYEAVMALYRAGIYDTVRYSRDRIFRRGEFALVLAALLEPSFRTTDAVGAGAVSGPGIPSEPLDTYYDETSPYVPSVPAKAFDDVPESSSLYKSVMYMRENGIMDAVAGNEFRPNEVMTAAQFTAAAVRLYEKRAGRSTDFTPDAGKPWYEVYVRKSAVYGIYPSGVQDFNAPVSRRQAFFSIYGLAAYSGLEKLRSVARIPDLSPTDPQYNEVLALYEAGIAGGKDQYGTFGGAGRLTRAECATMLYRIMNRDARSRYAISLMTGMKAFRKDPVKEALPFNDVSAAEWYAGSVSLMYRAGLMSGRAGMVFCPNGSLTVAEAVTLAVRVYEYYHGLSRSSELETSGIWYAGYVELGKIYGITDSVWWNYDSPVTREQLAYLAYHALPESELAEKNKVTGLPDVLPSSRYYDEVLALYRAGITSGVNEYGDFRPDQNMTRAEAAATFARLIYPERRLYFTFKRDLRQLKSMVEGAVSGYSGKWSVYFYDAGTGTEFVVNDWRMWSASVVKLYVAGAVLEAIQNGLLANTQYVQNNLRDMLTWSSNTAWSNLYTVLGGGNYGAGRQKVNDFCDSHGYPNSGHRAASSPYNTTKAKEAGLFLRRLLNGTNVSSSASNQMLTLLKAQQRISKIPAGVPSGVVTANKTGELYGSVPVENDAAIVFAPSGTYILVVLTERGSVSNIKKLSSEIYDWLN